MARGYSHLSLSVNWEAFLGVAYRGVSRRGIVPRIGSRTRYTGNLEGNEEHNWR